jgi:L-amino acid N-acyltransferase YncA
VRSNSRLAAIRCLGPATTARAAQQILFSTRRYLGLRCALDLIPPTPDAKVPVRMVARAESFGGFSVELGRLKGVAWLEAYERARMLEARVQTLYAAETTKGQPIYAQWLVSPETFERLDELSPHRYPRLSPDECLVEGAYTFTEFRGLGTMAAGMAQLLVIARASGHRSVVTYVRDDNVPSLRGCARVGFRLDHLRVNRRRFGRHYSHVSSPDEEALLAWEQATAR